jgi:uncharacterized protein (TIGR03437 family)
LSCFPALAVSPPVYHLTTVAGSDQVGDGGQAVAAQVAQPEGIVVDPAGNLYIADAANNRVRKVTPAGVISTVAGNGHRGFSGDNGLASVAQLNQPYGLALDAAGNLYIADYGNQRVRAVGTNGNITTVAGNGPSGTSADGGPATAALLVGPHNLATDPAGNLYISEREGQRVRKVVPGGKISTFAGTGIAGYSGDSGPATAAQLAFPEGLALDGAGNLYIVDSLNMAIREVRAGAGTLSTVCSLQTFSAQNSNITFVQLSGLAANAAGDPYFPESVYSVVWQLTSAGVLTPVAGVVGVGGSTGDGQLAVQTALNLNATADVTLDAAGDLYISEVQRVRCVTAATGIVNTVAGDGTFGFGGDGGSALLAVFNTPTGLAFNNGSLHISDLSNQRVRRVGADGKISTVAGNGTSGYLGDGGPAVGASLTNPNGLAFDPAGNLYIADSGNNRARQVNPSEVIATFAGSYLPGLGGDGDQATQTPLKTPQGVVADLAGNVYIADTGHNRVIRVDAAGNIQTVAGTGTLGDAGGNTSWSELNAPGGVALDSAGNLYIADTYNHRIRVLTPGGAISTLAGTGTGGFSGDGGAAAGAELNLPSAVAVDASGNIYIADTGNHRVRLVTTDGEIATVAGTGDGAYNGDNGAAVEIALSSPYGLALDGQGNVFVADTGNNRVRRLSTTQTVVTPPPAQLIKVALANAASLLPGPLAPGEIFSIFGQGIGPAAAVTGNFDASGTLSTTLANVQVLFTGTPVNATPAPLFYVQSNQINAQVPYEMAGQTIAQLQVVYQGATLASMQVPIADANPALFTVSNGTGNAVVVNQDGSINSDKNPAPRGSIVVLYATGEGQTSLAGLTGQAAQAPFPLPVLPVSLTMAGYAANVLFAGDAPGFVGVMQINAQVPSGFVPTGDLAVVLTVGLYQSPAGVTIAVE